MLTIQRLQIANTTMSNGVSATEIVTFVKCVILNPILRDVHITNNLTNNNMTNHQKSKRYNFVKVGLVNDPTYQGTWYFKPETKEDG